MSQAGLPSSVKSLKSGHKAASAYAAGLDAHPSLSQLPLGDPMEAPALPLAPRRPTSDRSLLMAWGLNKTFLQEQDFELDQRLRQLPSGALMFLHQDKLLHHVFDGQKKLYNATPLMAGAPVLTLGELDSAPARRTSGQPDSSLVTGILLKTLPMALPLIEAEARLFATHMLGPRQGQKINLTQAMDDLACRVLTRLILPATPPEAILAVVKATEQRQETGILNDLARLPVQSRLSSQWKSSKQSIEVQLLRRRLSTTIKTMRKPAVAQSMTGLNGQDVLLQLVSGQLKPKLTDNQIVQTLHAVFGGLRHQLRSMLIWTFGLLAHQAQFRHICEMEADLLADTKVPLAMLLEQAAFTTAAIEECWRLYPPVPVMVWKLLLDDKIGRISIKAGSHVAVSPYVLHRHKDFWPHAHRFDPARFMGSQRAAIKPYAYLPFGEHKTGSDRALCPNTALFQPVMTILLLSILHRIRFVPLPDTPLPQPVFNTQIEPSKAVFMTINTRIAETDEAKSHRFDL